MNFRELAQEVVEGRRFGRDEDLSFFIDGDLADLQVGADLIRAHFCGNRVDLCTIISGRMGQCEEDCRFCAQSGHHNTGIVGYPFLGEDEILESALENERCGVHRFSIVTSGRSLRGADFEKALQVYQKLHERCQFGLCASFGLLNREQFRRLRQVGVESYHENIETSRRNFPNICTTHTYEDKIESIQMAQEEGFCVCSGFIIGMGEDWADRLDMALSLRELGVESIPINVLIPILGTPFGDLPQLPKEDAYRTIAFCRFINPTAHIRLGAGRKVLENNGETAFKGGASATITGNLLTTSGFTIAEDKKMLERIGREVTDTEGRGLCRPARMDGKN